MSTYRDNCFGIAKGAAYSALLSFFPVLTTITALLVQANAYAVSRSISRVVYEVVPPGTENIVAANIHPPWQPAGLPAGGCSHAFRLGRFRSDVEPDGGLPKRVRHSERTTVSPAASNRRAPRCRRSISRRCRIHRHRLRDARRELDPSLSRPVCRVGGVARRSVVYHPPRPNGDFHRLQSSSVTTLLYSIGPNPPQTRRDSRSWSAARNLVVVAVNTRIRVVRPQYRELQRSLRQRRGCDRTSCLDVPAKRYCPLWLRV